MHKHLQLRFVGRFTAAIALHTLLAPCFAQNICAAKKCAYLDTTVAPEVRAKDLVGRMTLEEKVGQTQNHAVAIPRLGIPEYDWWNEALHGVARNGAATVFPQSTGLAATWDVPLLHQVADVIATEARAKSNDALSRDDHRHYSGLTFWSPNINILRDPRWGRGLETFGEDPYLTKTLGIAFVTGIQGNDPHYFKAVATPKHFAVHSGPEPLRHGFNVDVSPYDLEDTYLPAFRGTIVEGKADSIMCAYNAIDGLPACESPLLLNDHLRTAWGFKGYVVSDCDAVDDILHGHHKAPDEAHAAASTLKAGTDLDCGDAYKALVPAIRQHLVSESDLDTALIRLFTARFRLGLFDPMEKVPFRNIPLSENNSPSHRALALKVAEESLVLLKNDGVLPLRSNVKRIAIVGPSAENLSVLEGNYNGTATDPVTLLRGIRERFRGSEVHYAAGSVFTSGGTAPIPASALRNGSANGLKAEYFSNTDFSGAPALTRTDPTVDFDWGRVSPDKALHAESFSVRWTGELVPPTPGDYALYFRNDDTNSARFLVDGKEVSSGHAAARLHFGDTKPHTLEIDYKHTGDNADVALEWEPPPAALLQSAVEAAKQSDVVIACIGLSPVFEGEETFVKAAGFDRGDRTTIALPEVQRDLLEQLSALGKPIILVVTSGSGIALTGAAQRANAIVQAWYPGEAGGEAVARVLAGDANPAGRLPVTFYRSDADLPPFDDYSMRNRTYRYFDKPVLYPFGFGLSYSTFTYQHLQLSTTQLKAGDVLSVTADVTNSGSRAGGEVAELYLYPPTDASHAKVELEGFQRVWLKPGETKKIRFTLDDRQLSLVNAAGDRLDMAGDYKVVIGGMQPTAGDAHVEARFQVTGEHALEK